MNSKTYNFYCPHCHAVVNSGQYKCHKCGFDIMSFVSNPNRLILEAKKEKANSPSNYFNLLMIAGHKGSTDAIILLGEFYENENCNKIKKYDEEVRFQNAEKCYRQALERGSEKAIICLNTLSKKHPLSEETFKAMSNYFNKQKQTSGIKKNEDEIVKRTIKYINNLNRNIPLDTLISDVKNIRKTVDELSIESRGHINNLSRLVNFEKFIETNQRKQEINAKIEKANKVVATDINSQIETMKKLRGTIVGKYVKRYNDNSCGLITGIGYSEHSITILIHFEKEDKCLKYPGQFDKEVYLLEKENDVKKAVDRLNQHKQDKDNIPVLSEEELIKLNAQLLFEKQIDKENCEVEQDQIIEQIDDVYLEEKSALEQYYEKVDEHLHTLALHIAKSSTKECFDYDDLDTFISTMKLNDTYFSKMGQIKSSYSDPYVSRLKLSFEDGTINDIYVGKENISIDRNILVYSWYSEIGRKIYDEDSTSWVVKGKKVDLLMKRNILISKCVLMKAFESYNANKSEKENKYIADEYLLSILKERRNETELTDIVASIQKKQMNIIASDFRKNVIMQGCAGSGKTMVLFHRLKYLIGNNLIDNENVGVITPNDNFTKFVLSLTKSLNLNNLKIWSVKDYYINLLNAYLKKSTSKITFKNLFESGAIEYEEDYEMDQSVVKYLYSDEFLQKVKELKAYNIKPIRDVKFNEKGKVLNLLSNLLGRKEIELFPKYERNTGKIHKCELYALALFYFLRCGIYCYQESQYNSSSSNSKIEYFDFKHEYLFIDEAQDYSTNEFKLLRTINNNPRFNLFGDLRQSIFDHCIKDWHEVTKQIGSSNIFSLNRNYRNTSQITKYNNRDFHMRVENVGFNGDDVEIIKFESLKRHFKKDKNIRKAIICSLGNKRLLEYRGFDITRVFTVPEIKGMEFDSVYVIKSDLTTNERYIANTRGLNKLVIVDDSAFVN